MSGEAEREFDVVVMGATGFTGRLVAEYLLGHYRTGSSLRWALAGRNEARLEDVRHEICEPAGVEEDSLPLIVADSNDAASLEAMAARTKVVCTTVGPYAKYGEALVAACAKLGTDYCDLTGELQWMRRMIDRYQDEAKRSGARIVHASGFDSIPSDLGVFFMQREMQKRHEVPCSRVRYRVDGFEGGISGGTAASMVAMMEEAGRDPSVRKILADPYAICPDQRGPDEGDQVLPAYDDVLDQWTGPFVMQACNTRIVRRSNALQDFAYGKDFRYDEAILTGAGPTGFAKASALAAGTGAAMTAFAIGPIRRLLSGRLPEPGTGPSPKARERGYYDIVLVGEHPSDPNKSLRGHIHGDRDPGYGSTSKMLGEAAVCLALDPPTTAGGFWTPASCMGEALLERLGKSAGVSFTLVDGDA